MIKNANNLLILQKNPPIYHNMSYNNLKSSKKSYNSKTFSAFSRQLQGDYNDYYC